MFVSLEVCLFRYLHLVHLAGLKNNCTILLSWFCTHNERLVINTVVILISWPDITARQVV